MKSTSFSGARFGSQLADGEAHAKDHATWSRRSFLQLLGLGGVATSLMAGGLPMQAFARHAFLNASSQLENDRILVVIQLFGGNDGLNTLVPVNNDIYYRSRPSVAISRDQTLTVNQDLGFHPALTGLKSLWDQGKLSIMQDVGYPEPSKSHFRSRDIWMTGSESEVFLPTGWAARYIEDAYPNLYTDRPVHPLLVQVGQAASMMFTGQQGSIGLAISNDIILDLIAEQGKLYDESNVPANEWGEQLAYIRGISNDANVYGSVVNEAINASSNSVEYPGGLGKQLASVARMIKGGLQSKIYLLKLGGWDHHINLVENHQDKLATLNAAMKAFQDDLDADGHGDRVLTITSSEFGRRIYQNGSGGTDHGEAGPLFVMGSNIIPGIIGDLPDLSTGENVPFQYDYRAVYATILEHWLGVDAQSVQEMLFGSFEYLPFIQRNSGGPVGTSTEDTSLPKGFVLEQNYPNPFNPTTTIRFELAQSSYTKLTVYDMSGRAVRELIGSTLPAGAHTVSFDASGLASGTYLYRLQLPQGVETRTMTLLR